MGFQVGNFSLLATKSMHSVDSWLSTIQANLNGATRNAFKESEITYGGNITYQLKNNRPEKAGEQIAEQVLTTGHTRVNWTQGSMVSSTQDTHFAIQGEGFFAVVDFSENINNRPINSGEPISGFTNVGGKLTFAAATANEGKVYLTRDGEFHFAIIPSISDTNPVLVDSKGMGVLTDRTPINGSYGFVFKSTFDSTSDPTFATIGRVRPTVFNPSYDVSGVGLPVTTTDYNELQYSRFGSTYYDAPTATTLKPIVNGSNDLMDAPTATSGNYGAVLIEKQLEASNTKVEKNIVEMSILGKVYNGFVQVIKMYNANIDEMLNFIR